MERCLTRSSLRHVAIRMRRQPWPSPRKPAASAPRWCGTSGSRAALRMRSPSSQIKRGGCIATRCCSSAASSIWTMPASRVSRGCSGRWSSTDGAVEGWHADLELDSRHGGRATHGHTDVTSRPRPPQVSVLRAVVVPPARRRHLWANTAAGLRGAPAGAETARLRACGPCTATTTLRGHAHRARCPRPKRLPGGVHEAADPGRASAGARAPETGETHAGGRPLHQELRRLQHARQRITCSRVPETTSPAREHRALALAGRRRGDLGQTARPSTTRSTTTAISIASCAA